MAMTAMPMLIHGPDAYFSGWEQPAAPIPRWAELAGDIPRIVDKIIFPILNSEDITVIFPEKWTDFKEWRDMAAESPSDLDALLQGEDAIDGELQRIFTKSSERLGDEWTRALLGGLRFRKVVRETVLRHADIWPEDSWNTIARPMALNELCLVCILHHLETGEGGKSMCKCWLTGATNTPIMPISKPVTVLRTWASATNWNGRNDAPMGRSSSGRSGKFYQLAVARRQT